MTDLDDEVRRRRERRERWEEERHSSPAELLALVGSIGWSIVLPALAGVALGRWMDRQLDSGIQATAALMFVGLVLGCVLAWKQVGRVR